MARKKKADAADHAPLLASIQTKARQYLKVQTTRIAYSNAIWKMANPRPDSHDVEFPALAIAPLEAASADIEHVEEKLGKELAALVKAHPFFGKFVENHKGIGALGVGSILGVVGDLDRYPQVSSLWHYCGGNVVGSTGNIGDGRSPKRQRGVKVKPGDPLSYNPNARTILWRQADAAIKSQNEYRSLYDKVRAATLERPRIGPSGCPMGQVHQVYERRQTATGNRKLASGAKTAAPCIHVDKKTGKEVSAHVNNHARRLVWKQILQDLWSEWQLFKKGRSV